MSKLFFAFLSKIVAKKKFGSRIDEKTLKLEFDRFCGFENMTLVGRQTTDLKEIKNQRPSYLELSQEVNFLLSSAVKLFGPGFKEPKCFYYAYYTKDTKKEVLSLWKGQGVGLHANFLSKKLKVPICTRGKNLDGS